jgi:sialic acid synthase SpsE
MSNYKELDKAVDALRETNLTIMQCSSEYPCPNNHAGLNIISILKSRYGFPVGLSDHTSTIYTALAAIALGAEVIEKHFTLDNELYDPDASFALTPDKFKEMVEGIHIIEEAMTPVDKDAIERFGRMKDIFQKSLVSTMDIPCDSIITKEMIGVKKPGTGLPPEMIDEVIGKPTKVFIPKDSTLQAEDIKW